MFPSLFPLILLLLLLLTISPDFVALLRGPIPTSYTANVHQTLLIELISSPPAHSEKLGKRGTDEGGGGRGGEQGGQNGQTRRKGAKERVARHQQQQKGQHQQQKKCEKLSEHQKYGKLERVGGRNQLFMAASSREAGRNFPTLVPQSAGPNNGKNDAEELDFVLMDDDEDQTGAVGPDPPAPPPPPPPPIVEECDNRCREIERKLDEVTRSGGGWGWKEPLFRLEDDPEEEEEGEAENNGNNWATAGVRVRRNGCYFERFVPIGNCTEHGFAEGSLGDEKLCTACQGIFVLNRECFPVFVNSVVCGRREFECIYDRLSGSAQGKCRPKVLSFKVMHNRGTKECEQWAFEYIEVPVACECYLSKVSCKQIYNIRHIGTLSADRCGLKRYHHQLEKLDISDRYQCDGR